MTKSNSLKKIKIACMLLGMFSFSIVNAQTIILEAESATTIYRGNTDNNANFSNGKGIGGMSEGNSSYIQFSSVTVATAGTYDLAIFYATMNERSVYVKVNQQVKSIVNFTDFTGGWDGTGTPGILSKTIQVYLNAGVNALVIGGYGGFAPNLDKLELTPSGTEITPPADDIAPLTIEAENAAVIYHSNVDANVNLSNGKGIGSMNSDNTSYLRYINVNVVEAGTYDLAIYYITMQNRSVYVKVNQQVSSTVAINDLTGSWDGSGTTGIKVKTKQIYLKAGNNTLEVGGIGGWAPNLDKFVITKCGTQITEPLVDTNPAVLEAESANDLFQCTVDANINFSGCQGIGGISSDAASFIQFNTVNAAAEGTYDLAIYYVTMDARSVYTKVNQQVKTIVTFADNTPGWDGAGIDGIKIKKVQVYLTAGNNTLRIGGSGGFAPNLDKFILSKSATEISRPADEIGTKVSDVSMNNAKIISESFYSFSGVRLSDTLNKLPKGIYFKRVLYDNGKTVTVKVANFDEKK